MKLTYRSKFTAINKKSPNNARSLYENREFIGLSEFLLASCDANASTLENRKTLSIPPKSTSGTSVSGSFEDVASDTLPAASVCVTVTF